MAQQRRRIHWFWWIILAVLLMFGVWQLASLFHLFDFNVEAMVGDTQPGNVAEANPDWAPPVVPSSNATGTGGGGGNFAVNWQPGGTGNEGTGDGGTNPGPEDLGNQDDPPVFGGGGGSTPGVTIVSNSEQDLIIVDPVAIDFGYVFPGEIVTLSFTVSVKTGVLGTIDYTLEMVEPDGGFGGANDIRPLLIVQKDPENESDWIADGTSSDYLAEGTIIDTDGIPGNEDESDTWLVTFYVPDETGVYWAWVWIEPFNWVQVTPNG